MIRSLSGDQGQAFQTHALQIILFGPFTYEPTIMCGSLLIVSPQLESSVGKACVLAQAVEQEVLSSLLTVRCHVLT